MGKFKRLTRVLVVQVPLLLFAAFFSFQITKIAFASTTVSGSLGASTPASHTDGNATVLTPDLTLSEGNPTFRLFNVLEDQITWNSTDGNYVNGNYDNYAIGFHAFNYNTNCYHPGVTEAHDAQGNMLNGSTWGNNLPNSNAQGDFKKNAYCSGQSQGSENNEVRFTVRNGGSSIAINAPYFVYASFVDYTYPGSDNATRAWVSINYNFFHDYYIYHDDVYYHSSKGDKICVNGYNQVTFPPGSSGNCP